MRARLSDRPISRIRLQDIRYEYDASNVTECKFVENTYTDTETTDTEPPDPEGGDTNGTD